jgi:hypothetical protein
VILYSEWLGLGRSPTASSAESRYLEDS